jgi:hypothetical protein
MAETTKTLKTRIRLKYDTLANWNAVASTFVPNKGEVCFVEIPTGDATATTAPTVLFKVGDGATTWGALKWGSALAADVYAWAKAASKPSYTASEVGVNETAFPGLKKTGTITGITMNGASKGISGVVDLGTVVTDVSGKQDKAISIDGITATSVNAALKELSDRVNGKYSKPTGGIPKSDLASAVQASLDKADSALQAHQTVTLESGTNNGTLKLTVNGTAKDNIAVKGLGSAAYTNSGTYATAAQGAKADAALPKSDFDSFKTANTAAIADAKKAGTDAASSLNSYKTANDAKVSANASAISTLQEAMKSGVTFKGKLEALPAASDYSNGDLIIVGTKEYICLVSESTKSWVELGDEGTHLTKSTADGYYVTKNAAITAGTGTKISYDSKGLVTGSSNLAASDIPNLDAAKITSGTLPDARIASADTWNGKQDKITANNKLAASLVSGLATVATSGSYNDLTNKPTIDNSNQKVAVGTTGFGANDTVKIAGGTNISVSADTTNKTITISGKSDADIKTLAEAQIKTHGGVDKTGTVTSVAAGTGLKISGTASVSPTVGFDDNCTFVFDCGGAPAA